MIEILLKVAHVLVAACYAPLAAAHWFHDSKRFHEVAGKIAKLAYIGIAIFYLATVVLDCLDDSQAETTQATVMVPE